MDQLSTLSYDQQQIALQLTNTYSLDLHFDVLDFPHSPPISSPAAHLITPLPTVMLIKEAHWVSAPTSIQMRCSRSRHLTVFILLFRWISGNAIRCTSIVKSDLSHQSAQRLHQTTVLSEERVELEAVSNAEGLRHMPIINKKKCLSFNSESAVFNLKCRHYFHQQCLKKWHEKHNTCPLCRKELR